MTSRLPFFRRNVYNSSTSFSGLSESCKLGLVNIATEFRRVQSLMLAEVEAELQNPDKVRALQNRENIRVTRLESRDAERLRAAIVEQPPPTTSNHAALLNFLADISYVDIWNGVAMSMLVYQGHANQSCMVHWSLAKQRAKGFLDAWDAVQAALFDVSREIKTPSLYHVYSGIEEKSLALERFLDIYNRRPQHDKNPGNELVYLCPRYNAKYYSMQARSNLQQQPDYSRTLIAATGISVAVSAILIGLAWKYSVFNSSHGTTDDADFWLLAQSFVMQLLGIFTAVFPTPRMSAWTWFFALAGASCALGALMLYLYQAKIYSALLSYLGSAAQAYMTLMLALAFGQGAAKVKKA